MGDHCGVPSPSAPQLATPRMYTFERCNICSDKRRSWYVDACTEHWLLQLLQADLLRMRLHSLLTSSSSSSSSRHGLISDVSHCLSVCLCLCLSVSFYLTVSLYRLSACNTHTHTHLQSTHTPTVYTHTHN